MTSGARLNKEDAPADEGRAPLANRVAVVTGGGNGIGAATVERLALLGASVGIVDLDVGAAEAVAARLHADANLVGDAGAVVPVEGDVASSQSVRQAFAAVTEALGAIDILVNNAGVSSQTPFLDLSDEEWAFTLANNLTGVYLCCKAVVAQMCVRRSGAIVNVSSVSGKRGGGLINRAAYASSKAGVLGLTKALARELAPFGVRVNAVAPGQFETNMSAVLATDPGLRERIVSTIPLARVGLPFEAARVIAFLACDDASYITGETINIDGGLMTE